MLHKEPNKWSFPSNAGVWEMNAIYDNDIPFGLSVRIMEMIVVSIKVYVILPSIRKSLMSSILSISKKVMIMKNGRIMLICSNFR